MDPMKKKRIKQYISWISLAALVLLLTAMPLIATAEEEADGPQVSILSGTVETGSISTGLNGGGTLTTQDAVEIAIPSGVKITEFLVENGDLVQEGTPLASIDRTSVMKAIASVQETLDHLASEMSDVSDESASTQVTAQAGGFVKEIYAQEGEQVQDVMLRDGALALLSLDGLMAADISCHTKLVTGDGVTVVLEDKTELSGRVESNMDGILTVTVTDDGFTIGTPVQVFDTEGNILGSGELYVHNAWRAVAYTGTVSRIHAKVHQDVRPGTNLITLKDTEFNAQMESLLVQYADYEDLMLELFRMYQSTAITAPCSGMVSGIDRDSMHLLSAADTGYTFTLLANAPNRNDQQSYTNFVGMVTGVDEQGNWNLAMNPQELEIPDYTDLSDVPTDPLLMNQRVMWIPTAPVYSLISGVWVQLDSSSVTVGDILLFACDETGNFVWVVRISSASGPEDTKPTTPPEETTPESDTDPSAPTEAPTEPEDPDNPTDENFPEQDLPVDVPFPGISGMPDGFFGGAVQEERFELFDLEGSVLMSVIPQETMKLTVAIDEQDISKIKLGMPVQVFIPALNYEVTTATLTDISATASNHGGSSKFTVEITMNCQESMLNGMSAVATIPLSTKDQIPLIPVEALVEIDAKTYVYTGYDEKQDILTNPVEVRIGVSDGTRAEILSGLEAGDTYWYSYYETLKPDTSAEANSNFPGMGGFR